HLRRRTEVVEQRFRAREAPKPHELLVVQRAIGLAELRVALVRNLSEPEVIAHTRFPRRACSRSMASNNDLKFPSPNPRDPCRSMTSKNNFGRSATGCGKIWSRYPWPLRWASMRHGAS